MQHYRYRGSRKQRYAPPHSRIITWIFFSVIACIVVAGLAVCLIYPWKASQTQEPETTPVFAPVPAVQTSLEYRTVQYPRDQIARGPLILVNNEHLCEFLEDNSLISVYDKKGTGYKVSDTTVKIQASIIDPFNEMMETFYQFTGYSDVMAASGYRSKEHQTRIFNNNALENGLTQAEKWIARPGGSEHHTGYVIDLSIYTEQGLSLDYDGTGECRWINANCQEYGFVVRYPQDKTELTGIDYEPWHFRYVGKPHAIFMTEQNLCLEEYIEYIKQYPFEKGHLQVTDGDDVTYEIYYVPAQDSFTGVPVPKDKSYEISGNNVDGFIVTVTL